MPKVIFKFDKEKDLWNHWHKSNYKTQSEKFQQNATIKKICEGKKFEECKKELLNYLIDLHNSRIIDLD